MNLQFNLNLSSNSYTKKEQANQNTSHVSNFARQKNYHLVRQPNMTLKATVKQHTQCHFCLNKLKQFRCPIHKQICHQLVCVNNQLKKIDQQKCQQSNMPKSTLTLTQQNGKLFFEIIIKFNKKLLGRAFQHFATQLKKITSKIIQIFDDSTMILLRINFYALEQSEISQTKRCNFAHFHVLNILNCCQLLSYYKNNYVTNLRANINCSLKKILQKDVRKQLGQQTFYQISLFAVKIDKLDRKQVLNFIRIFLKEKRAILSKFYPYYYNMSVFAANKFIIFQNQSQKEYIQYSIPYKHHRFYKDHFNLSNVLEQIKLFQNELRLNFHSEYGNLFKN